MTGTLGIIIALLLGALLGFSIHNIILDYLPNKQEPKKPEVKEHNNRLNIQEIEESIEYVEQYTKNLKARINKLKNEIKKI